MSRRAKEKFDSATFIGSPKHLSGVRNLLLPSLCSYVNSDIGLDIIVELETGSLLLVGQSRSNLRVVHIVAATRKQILENSWKQEWSSNLALLNTLLTFQPSSSRKSAA